MQTRTRVPVSCPQVLVWVVVNGQKYHMANENLTLDMEKLRAAVGPVEQAKALGVPTDDCSRLFEMYAAIVSALMERCKNEPNPEGYGSDLPPLLTRIREPLGAENPTFTLSDGECFSLYKILFYFKALYFRELPLGSQSHFRISSLCVCARVPFVL